MSLSLDFASLFQQEVPGGTFTFRICERIAQKKQASLQQAKEAANNNNAGVVHQQTSGEDENGSISVRYLGDFLS